MSDYMCQACKEEFESKESLKSHKCPYGEDAPVLASKFDVDGV